MKKRILSTLLVLCMVLALLPGTAMADDNKTSNANINSTGLTLSELKEKFPDGKYWNHVGMTSNNENGYTSTPCPSHGSTATCNAFTYNGTAIGWQCFGFACKLGYDAYGTNPKNWERAYDLNNIKPGDIINYDGDNPGHTVFVIEVSGETVKFAECNWGGRCLISWGRSLQKSEFNNLFSVYVAPYALSNDSEHTHNFSTTEYEEAHPHREYRKCSCGEIEYTGRTVLVNSCDQCYPGKYTVSGQIYCVYEDGTEYLVQSGEVTLYTSGRSYTLEIRNGRIVPSLLVAAGTYIVNITCPVRNSTTGQCYGKIEEEIQINKNIDLGQIKVPFYIFHHEINVRDAFTGEPLSGFDWTLWEGDQQKEVFKKTDANDIQLPTLRVGSTYALEIQKEGYLDFSEDFTPFIPSLGGEIVTLTDVYLQPTRGDFGNGVQWKVEDGVLTFWGNGPILDYPSFPPWAAWGDKGLIQRVVVKTGITRIGDRMMYGNGSREGITVSIPDTVTSIGEESLSFTKLRNIEIPASVRMIGKGAFDRSENLTIKFMGDAPELDERVFACCTGITVLYPAGNSTWDKYIGQNLGAEDDVTWQSYDQVPVDPTPTLDPTPTPVVPVIPSQPVLPGKPAGPESPETPEEPSEPIGAAVSFNDVRGHWAQEAIAYVSAKGIMTGTGESTFAPEGTMTRAMVWTVLARMSGQSVDGGDPWYALAQSWAVAASVSDGAGADGSITREQLVTMLYRFAGSPEVGAEELALLEQYAEGSGVSDWARSAMAWAVSQGVINGVDGALAPQSTATRAQVAAILARYCQSAE